MHVVHTSLYIGKNLHAISVGGSSIPTAASNIPATFVTALAAVAAAAVAPAASSSARAPAGSTRYLTIFLRMNKRATLSAYL